MGFKHDAALLKWLRDWDGRLHLNETQAEASSIQTFFVETWGYCEAGRVPLEGHATIAKFPISGEGAGGGVSELTRLRSAG